MGTPDLGPRWLDLARDLDRVVIQTSSGPGAFMATRITKLLGPSTTLTFRQWNQSGRGPVHDVRNWTNHQAGGK